MLANTVVKLKNEYVPINSGPAQDHTLLNPNGMYIAGLYRIKTYYIKLYLMSNTFRVIKMAPVNFTGALYYKALTQLGTNQLDPTKLKSTRQY